VELHDLLQSALNDRLAKHKLHAEKPEEGEVSDDVKRLQKVYRLLENDHVEVSQNSKQPKVYFY
jgi:hypothetical protein